MGWIGGRAIVLGASMGGLLAARVLADAYDEVVIVERDELSDAAENRRGVPQGRHVHALLPRCSRILAELFPGVLDELVAQGVPSWDDGDFGRLSISVLGHRTPQTGKLLNYEAIPYFYPSRPMLESTVRRRVRAIPNVSILEGHDLVGLLSTGNANTVTGAQLTRRANAAARELSADLVVDATGRGSRTPAFLDALGYGRPSEDELAVDLAYSSQILRIPPSTSHEVVGTAVFPVPGRPTVLALTRIENDRWLMTVGAMCGRKAPKSVTEMLSAAAELVPDHLIEAVHAAEPIGQTYHYRLPSNRWRRYDKMRRTPDGLLVLGDAICSFNPIYGQGMTLAAIEATVLRDCLTRGTDDLPRRYFRATARHISIAWRTTVGSDLALPEVVGRRSLATRITNAYVNRVLAAAETDFVVATQFLRVTAMLDSPKQLLRPSILCRVAVDSLRRTSQNNSGTQLLPA